MGFAGNALRRDGESRAEATLAEALAHHRACVYLRHPDGWLAEDGRFDFTPARASALGDAEPILLGYRGDGAPCLAMPTETALAGNPGLAAQPLRGLASEGRLDPELEGVLAQAEHLLNWHRRARFCGACGGETVAAFAGYRRVCTRCGETHFPRTDPVAIMLVHDGAGRCLLGRGPHFTAGMYSCLAGFVEPGETLEAAVRRETLEEAGIAVGSVTYAASQPWPFPGSLMLGCLAAATTFEVRFDRAELEACRWFGRGEVATMLREAHPDGLRLPQPFAIAHRLVRRFADGDF